jgi:hypothetical protein
MFSAVPAKADIAQVISKNRPRTLTMPACFRVLATALVYFSTTGSTSPAYSRRSQSSSLKSGTGQTKFRFGAIIRRGALQRPGRVRLWGKKARSLNPLHGRVFVCIPGARQWRAPHRTTHHNVAGPGPALCSRGVLAKRKEARLPLTGVSLQHWRPHFATRRAFDPETPE